MSQLEDAGIDYTVIHCVRGMDLCIDDIEESQAYYNSRCRKPII